MGHIVVWEENLIRLFLITFNHGFVAGRLLISFSFSTPVDALWSTKQVLNDECFHFHFTSGLFHFPTLSNRTTSNSNHTWIFLPTYLKCRYTKIEWEIFFNVISSGGRGIRRQADLSKEEK